MRLFFLPENRSGEPDLPWVLGCKRATAILVFLLDLTHPAGLCSKLGRVHPVVTSLLVVAISLLLNPDLSAQLPIRSNAATTPQASKVFTQLSESAQKASDENRLDDAVRLYAKALAMRSSWAEGWWALGTLEYDRDHYAKAATAFEKLIALQPKNGMAHAMLGLCEFELGRDRLSIQHLQRGKDLGLNKDDAFWKVVLYHEGVLLQRTSSFQAAQDTLEKLCLLGGPGDEVANVLGMTLLRLNSKEPPPQGSTDASVVIRIGRAECLAGQKKYDDARAAFEDVVKENPKFPNIHYAFGLFLGEGYDVASGVEQFKEEIANYPENVIARLRIAASLYKDNSAAAIPYAEEAVKLSPRLGFAHYLLGLLLLDADQSARAIPELEIAEKSFSRDPRVYAALGSAYSRVGRKPEAARARARFERLNKLAASSKQSSEAAAGDTVGITIGGGPPK
jgi:tetratricopeptide (TPR) repeat protein